MRRLDYWSDVTVVCGPTGSGKTTLVAMWAQTVTPAVMWCEPEHGRLPLSKIDEFNGILNGVLVIDDAEYLEDGEFVRLGRLIDCSPGLRVVLATRSQRTIRRLAAATHAAIDVITAADLAFSLEELSHAGVLENDTERKMLLFKSEGFAVAVREKLEDARRGTTGARERFRSRLQGDLTANSGWYATAVQLALLPRVDSAILEAWQIPAELIDELGEVGVTEWDDGWLSLHPYVRGVLLEDAGKLLSAEERHSVITLAVRTAYGVRDPLSALRAAFSVDDLNLATEVVFDSMIELLEMRDETYKIFTGVSAAQFRDFPVLTLMLILLSIMDPHTRPRALQLLATESLFQRLQPGRGSPRERLVFRVFEASVLRLTPLAASALPRVRRTFDSLTELSEEDMDILGRMGPMLYVHLGISAFYFRDHALARHCFELADARHLEAGRNDRVDSLSLRGGLAALSGDLPAARQLLDDADRVTWPTGWRESSPADFFNLGRAILAVEEGDSARADAYIRAAGPIEEILEHWPLFALLRARRDRLAGEASLGLIRLTQLRKVRGVAPGTPFARSLLDAAEAELLLSTGNAVAAHQVSARSAKHSATCQVALAWAELALGRLSSAARQAQRVIKDPLTLPRNLLEADLVLLCIALRNSFDEETRVIAMRVAERLNATGVRSVLRFIAPQDQANLAGALLRAGAAEEIVALIGAGFTAVDLSLVRVEPLTSREGKVLKTLAETSALDEIAERLFVSRNTVKSQVASIYRKLDVSSREEALTRAAVLGILD